MSAGNDLTAVRTYVTNALAHADALLGRAVAIVADNGGSSSDVSSEGARDLAYLATVAGKLRGELLGALAEIEPADEAAKESE